MDDDDGGGGNNENIHNKISLSPCCHSHFQMTWDSFAGSFFHSRSGKDVAHIVSSTWTHSSLSFICLHLHCRGLQCIYIQDYPGWMQYMTFLLCVWDCGSHAGNFHNWLWSAFQIQHVNSIKICIHKPLLCLTCLPLSSLSLSHSLGPFSFGYCVIHIHNIHGSGSHIHSAWCLNNK